MTDLLLAIIRTGISAWSFWALLSVCLFSSSVRAEEKIYSWKDGAGRVHYSNTPVLEEQLPSHLPELNKEDLNRKIEKIKAETPLSCEGHGGIDCASGETAKGTVKCLDGFSETEIPFTLHCTEVRLEGKFYVLFPDEPKQVEISRKLERSIYNRNPTGLQVTIRNLSGIPAQGMTVSFVVPSGIKQRVVQATGPAKVEAFGFADYNLSLADLAPPATKRDVINTKAKVNCRNCGGVLGKVSK